MASRGFINTGLNYATGRSPFAYDFSKVAEKVNERMMADQQQKIQQEKQYIQQSEALLLKALSFETIEGLGAKVQAEHLKNLQNLWDKWATEFSQKDGKLSMPDIARLQNDKNAVDSKLKTMQTDVMQYQKLGEMILQKKADNSKFPEMDLDKTQMKYLSYLPDVGSGHAMDIFTERYIPAIEEIKDKYDQDLWRKKQTADQIFLGLDAEGRATFMKDNETDLLNYFNKIAKENPQIAEKIKQEGYDKVFGQMKAIWGINQVTQRYIKPSATKGAGTYGSLNPAEKEQVDSMNHYLQMFTRADIPAITTELKNRFNTENVTVKKVDDGKGNYNITFTYPTGKMVGTATDKTPEMRSLSYTIPKDQTDPKKRKLIMTTILDKVLPVLMEGKNVPKYLQSYIDPNYEYENMVEETNTTAGEELSTEIDNIKIGKPVGQLATKLEELFPGWKVDVIDAGILKRNRKINIQAGGSGYEFDLSKKEDKERLKQLIKDSTKMEIQVPEGTEEPNKTEGVTSEEESYNGEGLDDKNWEYTMGTGKKINAVDMVKNFINFGASLQDAINKVNEIYRNQQAMK